VVVIEREELPELVRSIVREELPELVSSTVRKELDRHQTPRITLTVNEAAQAIGVSRSTMYRLLHDGTITSRTVGGRRLIAVSELHRVTSS